MTLGKSGPFLEFVHAIDHLIHSGLTIRERRYKAPPQINNPSANLGRLSPDSLQATLLLVSLCQSARWTAPLTQPSSESRTHFVDGSTTYRSDLDEEDIPSYKARCQTLHFGPN